MPESSGLANASERNRDAEIPLIEINNLSIDEYIEFANGKTYGEILGLLVPETLVDGKGTWEFAETAKHDLFKMLECCRAELEGMRAVGQFPAPHYFERAAILFRKQKEPAKEVEIIELYWRAIDEVMAKNTQLNERQGSALKQRFEIRHSKAKQLREKQSRKVSL